MAEKWQEVLGIDKIGINDNFFEMGGDSIKVIQIASRLNMDGYKLEIADLFRYPVISRLAPRLKKQEKTSDQSVITGPLPLTPIQEAFFRNHPIAPHHFNHTVMFYSKETIKTVVVQAVFQKIQDHHDALRITFKRDQNGEIRQYNQGLPYPLSLLEYDLTHMANKEEMPEKLENLANEIQASIDLENGPLMKVALFHLDDGDRLLIVLHHLVVDGISWRILFEDIGTLYRLHEECKPLELPSKTDSYKVWAEKLAQYADSPAFLEEKEYWLELEQTRIPQIEKDFDEADNNVKDTQQLAFTLSQEETDLLLTRVNNAFGTEVNDILLTALGLGTRTLYGHDRLLIAMEGHGREEIVNNIRLHRTVGWFTSIYPVILDMSNDHDLARRLKETKENIRRIPHKGIGYGILKFLTSDIHKQGIDFKLKPQICFNYLGQFDADIENMPFEIAAESTGNDRSGREQREYDLEIAGVITNKRLTISIHYNRKHFKTQTIEKLLENYKIELSRVISYCASQDRKELTPSDFTFSKLSIEKVEQLANQYPIEDIYALSPMQEGKLFHTLYNKYSSAGLVQMAVDISGQLDLPVFKRSVQTLVDRHDILRTVFAYKGMSPFIQIVLKNRPVEVLYKNLSHMPTVENKQEFFETFKEKNRLRSFDVEKDVLMQFAVFQFDRNLYKVIWTYHHILMDGWCLGIIFAELLKIYNDIVSNTGCKLEKPVPYKEYITWLESKDQNESKQYWRKYLDGFQKATGIPRMKDAENNHHGYKLEQHLLQFDEAQTTGLNKLAAANQVTLNTVIQAIWGILLGQYNREEDVLFGAVVSGRPSEIPGVESMIGLFINTIPVRITCKEGITFSDLFRQVQKQAVNSNDHHYFPLPQIQAESPLKRNLLDHIMVFENYPVTEQVEMAMKEKKKRNLEISGINIFIQPDYDLHVVVIPGDLLSIEFRINTLVYDINIVKEIAVHIEEIVDTIIENCEIPLETIRLSEGRLTPKALEADFYTDEFGF